MNKDDFRPTDAASVRIFNRSQVVRLLWEEEAISRAEIARRLVLSRSTVSAIISELIELGLAQDRGPGISTGGRRPLILGFRTDSYTLLGIDIGASHISAMLMNLKGKPLAWRRVAHNVMEDPEGTLTQITKLIHTVVENSGTEPERLAGIGIAVPSPVDARYPGSMSSLHFPAWEGYNVIDAAKAASDAPVFVDNDANLAVLAEHWWGEGQNDTELTYIELGTGIGAGHLIGGQIYRGAAGIAGEIGHVSIDRDGPQCACGLRGCLVTFIGAPALIKTALERGIAMDEETTEGLLNALRTGDKKASQLFGDAGRHLGVAVSSLINLMNPSRVILGGELSQAGESLLGPLREILSEQVPPTPRSEVTVTISQLGEHGTALGAATLALDSLMSDQSSLRHRVPVQLEAR